MARPRTKPALLLSAQDRQVLERIANSRTLPAANVQRAQLLLAYADGESVELIAERLGVNRSTVYRRIDKSLEFGWRTALDDLPRAGRPPTITPEAIAYLTSIAATKPTLLGSTYELWTVRHLTAYIRKRCIKAGHPSLRKLSSGTVAKKLKKNKLQPHRVEYYLERRDPAFTEKMDIVLDFYREVNKRKQALKSNRGQKQDVVYISYDEKPGIQAVQNRAPDLPLVKGKFACTARDSEYVRLGTMSLMAGMDLVTGVVHGIVKDRHRSAEFIQFLKQLIAAYPKGTKFRILLDNHSAHTSKETRQFLSTVPNTFEFTFTPVHGSWLNVIESFFSKMSRSMLRGIRVESKIELRKRILRYLRDISADPIPFHWKYLLEEASAEDCLKIKSRREKRNLSKLEKLIHSVMKDIA